MATKHFLDLDQPWEVFTLMHNIDVVEKSGGKLMRVNVLFEDCKNLVEQLLLMQIVKLQGSVHLVDDGVLVNESRELVHD